MYFSLQIINDFFFVETEELLQTTNLVHNLKKSHYDNSNYKKSFLTNGKANSLIDDKLIQSGTNTSNNSNNSYLIFFL